MKLYNANFSPNALRVRAVANELGIELEVIEVDLRAGENRTDTYLAMNPNAKVPVLVDGDFTIWESRAINSYLAGLRPEHGLYPDDPKARALVDQWSYWQTVHLGPAMQRVAFERFMKQKFGMGEPDRSAIDAELKNVDQFLRVFEQHMPDREWVAGQLSVADFALASTFMFRKQANISLDEMPGVSAWIARLEARDSWRAAVAPMMALMGA